MNAHVTSLSAGSLPATLFDEPACAGICRTLLAAGDDGLPAAELAQRVGLSLTRAAAVFETLRKADVLTLSIRERRVCYSLRARAAVDQALRRS